MSSTNPIGLSAPISKGNVYAYRGFTISRDGKLRPIHRKMISYSPYDWTEHDKVPMTESVWREYIREALRDPNGYQSFWLGRHESWLWVKNSQRPKYLTLEPWNEIGLWTVKYVDYLVRMETVERLRVTPAKIAAVLKEVDPLDIHPEAYTGSTLAQLMADHVAAVEELRIPLGVFACVQIAGRTIEHSFGYRSERLRPIFFFSLEKNVAFRAKLAEAIGVTYVYYWKDIPKHFTGSDKDIEMLDKARTKKDKKSSRAKVNVVSSYLLRRVNADLTQRNEIGKND